MHKDFLYKEGTSNNILNRGKTNFEKKREGLKMVDLKKGLKNTKDIFFDLAASSMFKYTLKRIGLAVLTVFAVVSITFFAMHAIPGGPFLSEKAVSEEVMAQLFEKYGLDKPLIIQYLTYIKDVFLRFDFGPSLKQRGRMVSEIIGTGLSVSAKLGIFAAIPAIAIGIALGCFAAAKRGKFIDRAIMFLGSLFVSLPSFITGTLLLYMFSTRLGILPANASSETGALGLVLPIITLSLYPMAYIARLTRSSMLEVLSQDYIRVATAKGVSKIKVIFYHALKNALTPIITYLGPMLAYIVTGSLVVEQIFAVAGIGRAFVGSITGRDYPLIMGTTIVLSILVVTMNLIGDILYKIADPRIRLE